MSKIKVVHIITKLELGGAQLNTIYTVENLDNFEFDSYLISGTGGLLTERTKEKVRLIVLSNLVRQINPIKDIKALFKLRKILKKINPDIVHTHSSKAGILGRLAAFLAGVPVIVHSVHGFSFSPYQFYLKRWLFALSEKGISRITDCLVFVSRDDIEIAKRHKLIKNNFTLIRSGFPLKPFLKPLGDRQEIRKKYNIHNNDFVVGVIAPFKPQKGLFHLVEIASRVLKKNSGVVFFIAGDGELRDALEKKLREKKILKNFRLPGFIFPIEDVIDIFDIGVTTALWEGLPQSLVQMRLKKKAVIASDIPGNREIIKDSVNGFLMDVFDYKKFSEKILVLMNNREDRSRLENYDEDLSSWEANYMVKEQEKLYFSLLSGVT